MIEGLVKNSVGGLGKYSSGKDGFKEEEENKKFENYWCGLSSFHIRSREIYTELIFFYRPLRHVQQQHLLILNDTSFWASLKKDQVLNTWSLQLKFGWVTKRHLWRGDGNESEIVISSRWHPRLVGLIWQMKKK